MDPEDDVRSLSERRVGRVLRGKYHLERLLGVGGMAAVYAATHRNGKRFAVKVLHAAQSMNSGLRARFLREGYVANAVDHPGVVAVLDDDIDDEDGSAFLVMELLDGVTAEGLRLLAGSALPVPMALGIALELLDVLVAAHAKKIVHRDIKPANLFLLRDGRLKVLDFGIARLRDATPEATSTQTGQVLGTPAFMAPEQALAEGANIDERTDLWAVGATLFNLLSGELVHEGDNGRQLLVRAATTPARSLSSVAPELPPRVVEIVSKALAFERAERWETASEMREAIERVHLELYGPPSREAVRALLAEPPEPPRTEATEVSRLLPLATTTTAEPVSSHGSSSEPGSPPTRPRLVVAAVALAALAVVVWAARSGPAPESPGRATPAAPVRDSPAGAPLVVPVESAAITVAKELREPPGSATASSMPVARAVKPPAPAPKPAPRASVSAPTRPTERPKNPLSIELQ
jgi:serine/threonine-protein kinase